MDKTELIHVRAYPQCKQAVKDIKKQLSIKSDSDVIDMCVQYFYMSMDSKQNKNVLYDMLVKLFSHK